MDIIKKIKPGESIDDAIEIRRIVFIDEQHFSPETEPDNLDSKAYHVIIYREAVPVATGRVFKKEDSSVYIIGRVAVLKEHRKDGTGSLLMHELEKLAKSLGASAIELSAQCAAQGFYEKNGYGAYGDIYFDEHCEHISMTKSL